MAHITHMKFDYPKHRTTLLAILKDIYSDTTIAPFLGFKGGTAAMLFYELDRGSVDLDFDLLDSSQERHIFDAVKNIVAKYGKITDADTKRFNLIFVLSYGEGTRKVKVEINRRQFGSEYAMMSYTGIPMMVMTIADMAAHKLVAMTERIGEASRDIYDVHFFLKRMIDPNQEIIQNRTGMPYADFLKKCIADVESYDASAILQGLGELLSEKQKAWVKAKLLNETLFQLRLALDLTEDREKRMKMQNSVE